jgi:hypothetical protein
MRSLAVSILAIAVVGSTAQGHFIWVVPDSAAQDKARVVFSDSLAPDEPELLLKIAGTKLYLRVAEDKEEALTWTEGKEAHALTISGRLPAVVGGTCEYGVVQRGENPPALLVYHPKAILGELVSEGLCCKPWKRLELEIIPVGVGGEFQVVHGGQPLANAEVSALTPDGKAGPFTTDAAGKFALRDPKPGTYGLRVAKTVRKEGERDGKKYVEVRNWATLVVRLGKGKEQPSADPEASRLLAEARAARAHWTDFPGFTADVVYTQETKVVAGKVQVTAKGKVEVEMEDAEAQKWTARSLGSVVGHRIDNSAELKTACAFVAPDDAQHPFGRAVRVLDDEYHSSYRIRDKQILVVQRQMGDTRFTITVLDNRLNEEGKFLPNAYVVHTWPVDKPGLARSEAFHQQWQRLGKFDLPARLLHVVSTSDGKQEARLLKLTNHKLMP